MFPPFCSHSNYRRRQYQFPVCHFREALFPMFSFVQLWWRYDAQNCICCKTNSRWFSPNCWLLHRTRRRVNFSLGCTLQREQSANVNHCSITWERTWLTFNYSSTLSRAYLLNKFGFCAANLHNNNGLWGRLLRHESFSFQIIIWRLWLHQELHKRSAGEDHVSRPNRFISFYDYTLQLIFVFL